MSEDQVIFATDLKINQWTTKERSSKIYLFIDREAKKSQDIRRLLETSVNKIIIIIQKEFNMTSSIKTETPDWKKNTVPVRVARVVFCGYDMHQSVFLREIGGSRELLLFISFSEAIGIERKLRREYSSRPFTHDLIYRSVEILGGRFLDVLIHDVQGGTYYSRLRIKHDRRVITLDSRPSDALAIALSCKPPLDILVKEDLMHPSA